MRLLSLESRRADQMAKLIESHGGIAVVAPSMREIPLKENSAALSFAEELFAGKVDVVIFLTGVGTRILFAAAETNAVMVPEPNTWRDIIRALDQHQPPLVLVRKRIAVLEYGISNRELIQSMEARGALITPVPVYQWALPEDTKPLRRAIREIIDGKIDVLLITSANQVHDMMQITAQSLGEAVRPGLQQTLVVSVGPISTEALLVHGIAPDMEPTHPKMGQLVFETAEKAKVLLRRNDQSSFSSPKEVHRGRIPEDSGDTGCPRGAWENVQRRRQAHCTLFNIDGTHYAIDDTCTHKGGPLSEGGIEGSKVTCPWHGAIFDVTTSEVVRPPAPVGGFPL